MNVIRQAVAEGRPTFGIRQVYAGGHISEAIGGAGYEWAFLDAQHGGMTWENLMPVMQGLQLGGTQSVIRVGANSPRLIMRALDLGAIAVIVPMVSTPEEAQIAASSVRYPPEGIRSFGPLRDFSAPAAANEDVLCFVMIETVEGLENLEAIAATPGVDGIFVGPMDLALSLGHGADVTAMHPEVLAAIDRIVAACEDRGLIPGTVTLDHENAEDLLRRGVRLLTLGSDMGFIRTGAAADMSKAASWASEYLRPPTSASVV
jgi:4-hydroxy-2-oxoheptanedioate aldolase